MRHRFKDSMKIAIIGGGAAGCFAAINIARNMSDADITVYESGQKALAKVAVTGGGRCNLTNSFADTGSLDTVYPRGTKLMKRLLRVFSHEDTMRWFTNEGVRLVTQDDQCVFPASQNAMEIVNTLLHLMHCHGVCLKTGHRVDRIQHSGDGYALSFTNGSTATADKVIVTSGGSPRISGLRMLEPLDIEIAEPMPSLFSFNIADKSLTELSGTVVENVTAGLTGTKLRTSGPLLITHWGVSGPAILKLSSLGARQLNQNDYKATVIINWFGDMGEAQVAEMLRRMASDNPQKLLQNVVPQGLNSRLWSYLLTYCGMKPTARWAELQSKTFTRMAAMLTAQPLSVSGKNRTKEEFVTCGGVSLNAVNAKTLEAKNHPGLYFAGEVLDVDAITGGFNLQAAWTMAYVVTASITAE